MPLPVLRGRPAGERAGGVLPQVRATVRAVGRTAVRYRAKCPECGRTFRTGRGFTKCFTCGRRFDALTNPPETA